MPDVPRRPLLQSVPAALVGTALGGTATTTAASDGRPVADGGRGAQAATGRDPARTDVRYLTRERTTPVPPSDSDEIVIAASEGSILELQAITMSVEPVGPATSGRHAFEVGPAGTDIVIVRGAASNNRSLSFDGTTWRAADREATPSDEAAGALAARGLVVDDEQGLAVDYQNRTNAEQTSPRTVHVWAIEHAPPADDGDDAAE
jgi:hypothetical protein